MLARLFVFFGGLLVLALTAALVGPYFIDWTSYRGDFEREASAVLGRSVSVRGSATARLLPFPSVTFTDVAVGGGTEGQPAMTVEEFSMDAELAPFMRGEFLIFDMRLVRPRVTVAVDGDGRIDWAVRPSTPVDPAQIAIENLTITEGQVRIEHAASGREHLLSEINTVVSAKSLEGPWRIDGSLRVDGVRTAVGISTGKVENDGAMRVRVKADPAVQPFALETDGDLRLEHGAASYAGTFRIEARDHDARRAAEQQAAASGDAAKTARLEPPAWRAHGNLLLDHQRLSFDPFRLETGPVADPYVADGSAFVTLDADPRFQVTATGAQVRFDDAVTPGDTAGLTLRDRVRAIRTTLADLPRPSIPGVVDVDLPAVVAGDTTVRDVKLQAEPVAEGWNVKALSASLPGRTTLEGSGLLHSGEDDFGFTGSLLLAVGQPSGFAAWLSKDVDESIRKLPAAGFNAKVDLTEDRQTFSDLELILGTARFRGEIENSQPANAEPSTLVALTGGALDLDGLAAFSSLFVSDSGEQHFTGRDLDIRLKAGPVSAHGLTAEGIDAAVRLQNGSMEIDRLAIAGVNGTTVSATGKVTGFGPRPEGNIDASVVAVDLAPLIGELAAQFPNNAVLAGLDGRAKAYPGLLQDSEIDVVGTAARNDDGSGGIALSVSGKSGGTAFTLTASGNGSLDSAAQAPIKLSLSAENANAAPLMALYGLPALPLTATGSGQTRIDLAGTLASGLTASADFTGQDMQASFEGALQVVDGSPSAKGKARLEAADIEPWLTAGGFGIPAMSAGTPVSLAADVDYGKGLVVVSGIAGEIADGPVSGDVNAELADGVPHLSGDLSLAAVDLAPVAGMVVGDAALQLGQGAWPAVPFQPKAELPFTADLELSLGTVAAGLLGEIEDAHLQATVGKDGVRLSDVTGKLAGGELSGLFEARNNGGSALVSTQFKLTGADLGRLPGTGELSGGGDFAASLSATGKSVEALFASLSGSGSMTLRGIELPGINADAFPQLLAGAEKFGREIDAVRTAAFAPAIVSAGTLALPPVDLAFTVAAGVLRVPPVTLDAGNAAVASDLKVDFTTGRVTAAGTLTYAAGDDALVGSEPSVRFAMDGPPGGLAVAYDTDPLAQFLAQRALEREQARVEAMQASLIEKQRLRREVRYYASLQFERDRAAEEARRAQEEARRAAEDKLKAEEAARADAARQAQEAAKAADEERRRQEEDARRKADEAAKAEQSRADDARRAQAEEAAAAAAAEERRLQAQASRKAEAARQAKEQARQQNVADDGQGGAAAKSGIERAPLPPAAGEKAFDANAIGQFLKSLEN